MKKSILLTFIWCMLFSSIAAAQVILQFETRGSYRVEKIFPGDIIYLKLEGEKFWRESVYLEANPSSDIINFSFGKTKISDIKKILFKPPKSIGKGLKYSLLLYSGSVAILSPLNLLREDRLNENMLGSAAAAVVGAFTLPPLIKMLKIKRLGKKHRLRVLDISLPDGTKSIPDQ